MKKIIANKKDFLKLAYKLSYDLLALLLLTLAATLVAEGILPGLISSKISLGKITLAILVMLTLIIQLSKKLEIVHEKTTIKRNKILPGIVLFSFLLIGNSLLKFTFWENIIITLATLFILFLLYELILSSYDE